MNDNKIFYIFKAYDIRGKVGTELTTELLKNVGIAFADWLPSEGPIIVGYDMRLDSHELARSLMEGASLAGRSVIDIGMVTSDMAVFGIVHLQAAGAAIITASHNPGEYNGVKLYDNTPKTVGLDQGLDKIRDIALSNTQERRDSKGVIKQQDIKADWVEFALSQVDISTIPKLRIAIDAGNGMAGAILPLVLEKLPKLEVEQMYFDPDGTFPNHLANPQQIETLEDLQKVIADKRLDLGIAFDGDGDRMAMVDETGTPVEGSQMFSILAKKYLTKGSKFVHEVRTSRVIVSKLASQTGAVPVRSKSGRSNIGEVMRQEGAVFGGETTGHFFFEEYWSNDSGLMAMLVALEQIGKYPEEKLSEVVAKNSGGYMIPETNFEVKDADETIEAIANKYADLPQDRLDGLSVSGSDWWFNIRKSNTEPVIRLNAESSDRSTVENILLSIQQLI